MVLAAQHAAAAARSADGQTVPASPSAALPADCSWLFPRAMLDADPSLEDGLTLKDFLRNKYHAFRFIEEMRLNLDFPVLVMNTAMVFLHRFYVYQSMKDFSWPAMALCCLFVALKVEERVMRMESLLKWAHHVKCSMKKQPPTKLDVTSQEFWKMKEDLQMNERILLQTLGFDVTLMNPAFLTVHYCKTLKLQNLVPVTKELAKVAWTWCHASYGEDFCLLYPPEAIAVCFLYGAAKDLDLAIASPTQRPWWQVCLPPTIQLSESEIHAFMAKFYTYCVHYKEPRHPHKSKATKDDKDSKAAKEAEPPVKPPLDPARYRLQLNTATPSPAPAATPALAAAAVAEPPPSLSNSPDDRTVSSADSAPAPPLAACSQALEQASAPYAAAEADMSARADGGLAPAGAQQPVETIAQAATPPEVCSSGGGNGDAAAPASPRPEVAGRPGHVTEFSVVADPPSVMPALVAAGLEGGGDGASSPALSMPPSPQQQQARVSPMRPAEASFTAKTADSSTAATCHTPDRKVVVVVRPSDPPGHAVGPAFRPLDGAGEPQEKIVRLV